MCHFVWSVGKQPIRRLEPANSRFSGWKKYGITNKTGTEYAILSKLSAYFGYFLVKYYTRQGWPKSALPVLRKILKGRSWFRCLIKMYCGLSIWLDYTKTQTLCRDSNPLPAASEYFIKDYQRSHNFSEIGGFLYFPVNEKPNKKIDFSSFRTRKLWFRSPIDLTTAPYKM